MSKETETDHIFEKNNLRFFCQARAKWHESAKPAARSGPSRRVAAWFGPSKLRPGPGTKSGPAGPKNCLDRWAGNSWLGRDGSGRVVWVVPCHSGYVEHTMYQEVGLGCTDSNPVTTEVARKLQRETAG